MPTQIVNKPGGGNYIVGVTSGQYAVEYLTDPEEYREDWVEGNIQVQMGFWCRWNERAAFVVDMLGYSEVVSTGIHNTGLKRYLPEPHPNPEFTNCFCMELHLLGYAGTPRVQANTGQLLIFDDIPDGVLEPPTAASGWAHYQGVFRFPAYEVVTDALTTSELQRYVVKRTKDAAQNQQIYLTETGGFRWVSDQKDILTPLVRQRLLPQRLYTWHNIPAIPETSIRNCVGHTNQVTFDGFAPRTLLCLAPEREPLPRNSIGRLAFNLTYAFSEKNDGGDHGWDWTYRSGFPADQQFQDKAVAGQGLYPDADFHQLFQMP